MIGSTVKGNITPLCSPCFEALMICVGRPKKEAEVELDRHDDALAFHGEPKTVRPRVFAFIEKTKAKHLVLILWGDYAAFGITKEKLRPSACGCCGKTFIPENYNLVVPLSVGENQ